MFKEKLKGAVFSFILFMVGLFGGLVFLLPGLILLVLPYCATLSRRVNDYVVTLWLRLVPVVFGVKMKICGDKKQLHGPCLIILNHRTRFDWLFLFCFMMRMGDLNKHKIILKKQLKKIPYFGWSMQAANFLFISRDWGKDQQYLTDSLSYFRALNNYPLQLLIFPEGTDLSLSNKEKSQKYASKNGLPLYEYVLHPRTKGFVHCVKEMRKFSVAPTIINMSIGYIGAIPQNERDLALGNWPSEIHFFSEQIPSTDVPTDDQELENWLANMWQAKEEQLKDFYAKNRFNAPYLLPTVVAESFGEMKFLLGFWVVFFVWLGYSLMTSSFYWWYCILWSVFYIVWNYFTDGMDMAAVRKYVKKN